MRLGSNAHRIPVLCICLQFVIATLMYLHIITHGRLFHSKPSYVVYSWLSLVHTLNIYYVPFSILREQAKGYDRVLVLPFPTYNATPIICWAPWRWGDRCECDVTHMVLTFAAILFGVTIINHSLNSEIILSINETSVMFYVQHAVSSICCWK